MVQEAEKLKNNCPLSLVVNSITMYRVKVKEKAVRCSDATAFTML